MVTRYVLLIGSFMTFTRRFYQAKSSCQKPIIRGLIGNKSAILTKNHIRKSDFYCSLYNNIEFDHNDKIRS